MEKMIKSCIGFAYENQKVFAIVKNKDGRSYRIELKLAEKNMDIIFLMMKRFF